MDKQTILTAAVRLAETHGYRGVFKRHIAEALDCGMGTVNYHVGTMDNLRTDIVKEALRLGHRQILAQAIALREPCLARKNLSSSLLPRGQRKRLTR